MTDLAQAFAGFRRSAWRLASLDRYAVESEVQPLRVWRERREFVPADDTPEWLAQIGVWTAESRAVGRVQVVTRPTTEYMDWLMLGYRGNVEAGEEVRLAYRDEMPADLAGVDEDFWLFDDELVLAMVYDPAGAWLGATDRSEDLDRCLALRSRMLSVSRPFNLRMTTDRA